MSLSGRSVPPRSVLLFIHTLCRKNQKEFAGIDAIDNENENGASFETFTYTDQDSTTKIKIDIERDKDQHYNSIEAVVLFLYQ